MELVGEPAAFPPLAAGVPLPHQSREYCELRVYYGVDGGVEDYLRDVFVPACNRNGAHKHTHTHTHTRTHTVRALCVHFRLMC